MVQSEKSFKASEGPFEHVENLSGQMFDSLTEEVAPAGVRPRRPSRPITVFWDKLGTEQPASSSSRKQRRVLSRIVSQTEAVCENEAAQHSDPTTTCLASKEDHSPVGWQFPDAEPREIPGRTYSEDETMAAIRKVMVAQRHETNLRNLPELTSCDSYSRDDADDSDRSAGPAAGAIRIPGVRLGRIDRTQGSTPLFSRATISLATAVLVFHLSLAGFTAIGAAGFFTH